MTNNDTNNNLKKWMSLQESPYLCVTQSNKEKTQPENAIFPIIKILEGNPHQVGAGFLINKEGLFVTAKHVIMDVTNDVTNTIRVPVYGVMFIGNKQCILRPLNKAIVKDIGDIAIGILTPMAHKISRKTLIHKRLILSSQSVKIGDDLHAYSCPFGHSEGKKIYFTMGIQYSGKVIEIYNNGRDSVFLPNKSFCVDMYMPAGTSGGPVFNKYGHVVGIISTGYEGDNLSAISDISEVFDMTLQNVCLPNGANYEYISIRDLHREGFVSIK